MRFALICVLFAASITGAQTSDLPSAYDSVEPFIGTGADGNTFPGATLPFGMMQWSPDTRPDGWYRYGDKTIRGFSLTHISGAGCPVYADVPILPWPIYGGGSGPMVSDTFDDTALIFSHEHESAHPGYYSVEANTASDTGVRTELTVTSHAGIGRFYFPAAAGRMLLFKATSANFNENNRETDSGAIEIRGKDTVVGSVHSGGFCNSPTNYVLYFAAKFEKPFESFGTWTDKITAGNTSASGHHAGAYVSFASGAEPVVMKIGISFVSIENAEANLAAEIPGWDFDAVHASAKTAWANMLDGVQDRKRDFGAADDFLHRLVSHAAFAEFVQRRQWRLHRFRPESPPLAGGPAAVCEFFGLGHLPRHCAVPRFALPQAGQPNDAVAGTRCGAEWMAPALASGQRRQLHHGRRLLGDSACRKAYAFGARAFDLKTALHFMIKGATEPGKGPHDKSERPGLSDYLDKGYVSLSDDPEAAASITLEYASADFAVSRFAAALGDHAHAA